MWREPCVFYCGLIRIVCSCVGPSMLMTLPLISQNWRLEREGGTFGGFFYYKNKFTTPFFFGLVFADVSGLALKAQYIFFLS